MKQLLLDVDGTLLDFDASAKVSLAKLFADMNRPFSDDIFELYQRINRRLWEEHEQGLIPRDYVLTRRFDEMFTVLGINEEGAAFEGRFREILSQSAILIDGALPILDYLYQKYELYVVTNGVLNTQLQRMHAAGIDRFMKKIFISDEIGYQKPMHEFFDYCFKAMDNPDKNQVMIIGDSLSADIAGGFNSGITTCWVNLKNQQIYTEIIPDFEVNSLDEIRLIL